MGRGSRERIDEAAVRVAGTWMMKMRSWGRVCGGHGSRCSGGSGGRGVGVRRGGGAEVGRELEGAIGLVSKVLDRGVGVVSLLERQRDESELVLVVHGAAGCAGEWR